MREPPLSLTQSCKQEENEGLYILIKMGRNTTIRDINPHTLLKKQHGVFKRLRRNEHQLMKGSCKQLSTDCHS
jgi:hypothetical protein